MLKSLNSVQIKIQISRSFGTGLAILVVRNIIFLTSALPLCRKAFSLNLVDTTRQPTNKAVEFFIDARRNTTGGVS